MDLKGHTPLPPSRFPFPSKLDFETCSNTKDFLSLQNTSTSNEKNNNMASTLKGKSSFRLGGRIGDEEGNRGTIRYIGPVKSAKDPNFYWIGVEWDDPLRGKHDGSVVSKNKLTGEEEMTRYFICKSKSETCASFVKPSKISTGISFMDVLQKRYVDLDAPLEAPQNVFENAYANTSKGGKKAIEFYGERKIRGYQQLEVLDRVSMRGEEVSCIIEVDDDDDNEANIENGNKFQKEEREINLDMEIDETNITSTTTTTTTQKNSIIKSGKHLDQLAHLVEVDLQGNLLSSWKEVERLGKYLPKISILHLNSNSFEEVPAQLLSSSSPFSTDAFQEKEYTKDKSIEESTTMKVFDNEITVGVTKSNTNTCTYRICPFIQEGQFPFLSTLVLNKCSLPSWAVILSLLPSLPNLVELALANNPNVNDLSKYATNEEMGQPIVTYNKLEHLDLSNCNLSDWYSQVVPLSVWFPSLQSLSINDNQFNLISEVDISKNIILPYLNTLGISGNFIANWSSVNSLNYFPALTCLRLSNNPLLKGMTQGEARTVILGRVKNIRRLNGAAVNQKERLESEKAYLRKILREMKSVKACSSSTSWSSNPSETTSTTSTTSTTTSSTESLMDDKDLIEKLSLEHPRISELMQIYGDVVNVGKGTEGGGSLASESVPVKLVCMVSSSITAEPHIKRLPLSTTINRLKTLMLKLFKVDIEKSGPDFVLYMKSDKDAPPTILDDEEDTLGNFGVAENCEIFINEVDSRVKEKERKENELSKEKIEKDMETEMNRMNIFQNVRKEEIEKSRLAASKAANF